VKIERKIFINNDFDVVLARMQAREIAKEMGFGTADQARISLAASELARVVIFSLYNLGEIVLTDIADNGHYGVQVSCMINLNYASPTDGAENGRLHEASPVRRSLAGACQLVDKSLVEEQDEYSAKVTLIKWLK
jgi:serine/threonine-protein kinase RsbT